MFSDNLHFKQLRPKCCRLLRVQDFDSYKSDHSLPRTYLSHDRKHPI
jgi:hypothetical protein